MKPEPTKHHGIPFNFDGRTLIIPPLSLGALVRNYPDMTREEVAALLDLQNMQEAIACVFDVGGMKRKALEASTWGGDV